MRFSTLCAAAAVSMVFLASAAMADPVVTFSGSAPTVNENSSITFSISSLVSSSDPITGYSIDSGPSNGSLISAGALGEFTYTPTAYFVGSDSFLFSATDSQGDVGSNIVYLTVKEINLPPLVQNGFFATTENTVLEIGLSTLAAPTNGVPIASYVLGTPGDGSIVSFDSSTGILFYQPNTGFTGTDEFAWGARATNGLESDALLFVSVEPAASTNVPEPATLAFLSCGVLMAAAGRKWRPQINCKR